MDTAQAINHLKKGLKDGLHVSFKLIKTIVPFYIIVDIISHTTFANSIGSALQPIMGIFGLTGKMSLALISGYTVNLYAAIAALMPLNPNWKEITIIGLMTGISHNLVVEGAILHKTGANAFFTVLFRILVSFIAGFALNLFFKVMYG